jgi:hypothetical protein
MYTYIYKNIHKYVVIISSIIRFAPTHLTMDQGLKGKNPSNALQAASLSDHNELYSGGDDEVY